MKPFILEFIGGCWDGMNLHSDSPDPVEVKLAMACYAETLGGAEGKMTVLPSEYGTRRGSSRGSKYVVAHRVEVEEEVLIRLDLYSDDPGAADLSPCRRVLLDFDGGCLHGLRLDSHSPDVNEALLATSWFCLTEQGRSGATLGRGMHGLPYVIRQKATGLCGTDDYQVVRREEQEHQTVVCFQCRTGPDHPRPKAVPGDRGRA